MAQGGEVYTAALRLLCTTRKGCLFAKVGTTFCACVRYNVTAREDAPLRRKKDELALELQDELS